MSRLAHLPVTFFAVVMGVAGLALAWQRAGTLLVGPGAAPAGAVVGPAAGPVVGTVGVGVGAAAFWLALVLFAVIAAAYLAKIVRHPAAVRAELRHPVRIAFVPTATIALLLLGTSGLGVAPGLATVLWWAGAVGQVVATLAVLSAWISLPTFTAGHLTPAWFIPVVGLVVVPLAGVQVAPPEVSWAAFSVGVLFWIALLPLVLGRLFVHPEPVPGQLLPTLAVLVAPPAVAALAWVRLHGGEVDQVARSLGAVAVFFTLLLVLQAGRLRRIGFFLSWWAYSFPLAALSVVVTVLAADADADAAVGAGRAGWAWAARAVLAVVTVLVVALAARTVRGVRRGEICVPEVTAARAG